MKIRRNSLGTLFPFHDPMFFLKGLSKFTDVFRRHEIDLPTFKELTEEELKEIGINTFGK